MVTAHYTNGRTRDVTAEADFSAYDLTQGGFQTVTVSYDGQSQIFDVYVFPPETAPTETVTEPATEPAPEIPTESESPVSIRTLLLICFGCIVLLILLLFLKAKQAKKRRRRPRPVIKLD
jgi:hypothetical protein